MIPQDELEIVPDFTPFGVRAFTTTRLVGSFGTSGDEPVREVMARWDAVRATAFASGVRRLATAAQVHGADILVHRPGWEGWLRAREADGHASFDRGTAMAVTVADCVPVFIAHHSGAAGLLHSGWRGTAAHIIDHGVREFTTRSLKASELRVHLGPAICGKCYVVSPEVYQRLTGFSVAEPTPVDLRAIIAARVRILGVQHVFTSRKCTRCDNERFFSHRAGDSGRQISVIFADPG